MLKRFFALLGVILLLACVVTTIVFAVTGSEYFMGMLMITMLFPVLLWVYMFFYKLFKDKSKET